jgi:hypothetical protein
MPNIIDANGLQTATRAELVTFYTTAFQTIYGVDINLASDTPDGQMMNIWIQAVLDLQDLLTQINAQFDPDQATGVLLDQRVGINGIQRQAGTFTITNVDLVINLAPAQTATLSGLDSAEDPYTVSDNAGTQWVLITSVVVSVSGTYTYAFRAALPGATLTIPGTITNPVTIVLGVDTINNPTTYTTLGINEESDAQLKIRRQKSVSLSSQGYLAGLLAALENINGVIDAFVYENTTSTTDVNGVPGHSIWVIINGTAPAVDIATAIYQKRNAGCGMFGSVSYTITQVDGSPFIILWDVVTPVPLYIKFTATSLDGINPPNIAGIRSGLVTSFAPGVAAQVNVNDLSTEVQVIDNNCLVTNAGFSTSPTGPFTNTLTPVTKNLQFAVTSPNIIIIPMILNPVTVSLASLATQQFTALGGFGAYTYTIPVNNSGASIGLTGLYTAGAGTGIDTVRATDSQGAFAESTVTVV